MDGPDTDGTAEAEAAAAKAHDKSDNPDDVMDALEAAEAVYNQAHPEETAGGLLLVLLIHTALHIAFPTFLPNVHLEPVLPPYNVP